jgi:hypothetical protein
MSSGGSGQLKNEPALGKGRFTVNWCRILPENPQKVSNL